jgi:hypothetical protein
MCLTDKTSIPTDKPELLFKRPEILLHPNIPRPLHGLAPRTLMPQKEWTELRRATYARNNYHCFACGVYREYDKEMLRFSDESGETLDCHEFYKIDYEKKTMELVELVALCKSCHAYVHSGRMQSMYDKGQLDEEDCWLIQSHGERVLWNGGLSFEQKSIDNNDYKEEWNEWRLIMNGKEYYSKWRDYFDWFKNYMIG